MKKKGWVYPGIAVLLLLVIAALLTMHKVDHQVHINPSVVAVSKASYEYQAPTVSVIGNVVAGEGVDVSSKVSGIVKNIQFKSGQYIKQGDLLITLDNSDIQAMLKQSQVKLLLAQQNYDRYKKLLETNGVSHSLFDKYASELKAAQAQTDYEKSRLENTYIHAPFEGKIGIRKVNIGQYISPGQALVNLQAVSPLYVDFNVPEKYIANLKEGSQISITMDSSNRKTNGKVIALGSHIDLDTRTLQIRALINNPKLLPGMYVDVVLNLDQPEKVIMIPQAAIVYSPFGEYVYKVQGKYTKKINVTIGERIGDKVIVKKGISDGDEVVCAGQNKIHPGTQVNTVNYHSSRNQS